MRLPRQQSSRRATRRGSGAATPSDAKKLFEATFGLRTIDAKGVEFGELMRETLLWRYRDDYASVGKKNGLTQLKIPVTHRKLAALESRHRKVRPFHIIEHVLRIRCIQARCGLADHPHRGPRLHIQGRHASGEQSSESVLQLDRSPLVE